MNKNTISLSFFLVLSSLFFSGCGQGLQEDLSIPTYCTKQTCSQGGGKNQPGLWSWRDLKIDSTVAGGFFDGSQVISLSSDTPYLNLFLPLTSYTDILSFSKDLDSSTTLRAMTRTDGLSGLMLNTSLSSIAKPPTGQTSSTLPNGDSLPGLSGKTLTHEEINIDSYATIHTYKGNGALALYIETPLDPYYYQELSIKRKDNQVIGKYAYIPEKNSSRGGFFISMTLNASEIAQILKNL